MSHNNKAPNLNSVRELIYDTAQKYWLVYIDMEKKSLYKMPWELQTQIQSVIIIIIMVYLDKFLIFLEFCILENTKGHWWLNTACISW